ncbi:hypothetical protein L0F63_006254, partial [Massospora cicadina]
RQRISKATFLLQRWFRLWTLHKTLQELKGVRHHILRVARQALEFQRCNDAAAQVQALARARLARQRLAFARYKRTKAARVLQAAWLAFKLRKEVQLRATIVIQAFCRMAISRAAFLRNKFQHAVDCKDARVKGMTKRNRVRSSIPGKTLTEIITELNTMRNARCRRDVQVIMAGPRSPENIKALNLAPNPQASPEPAKKVRFDSVVAEIEPNSNANRSALPPNRPSILKTVSLHPASANHPSACCYFAPLSIASCS